MAQKKYLDLTGLQSIIDKLVAGEVKGMGLSEENFTTELSGNLTSLYNKLKDFDPSKVATDSTLTALQNKVNGLAAIINNDGNPDDDTIINRLNEVFAFLAEIPENDKLKALLDGKVSTETGKGLSTNDYTDSDKAAVATIGNKVDKVAGKGLSTNDYTTAEKNAVATIADKADSATTLAGYGITDAKIVGNTVTLGGTSKTFLTEHQSLDAYAKTADMNTALGAKVNESDLVAITTAEITTLLA